MADRCEHGLPVETDCEQCIWEQSVADDQASNDDGDVFGDLDEVWELWDLGHETEGRDL